MIKTSPFLTRVSPKKLGWVLTDRSAWRFYPSISAETVEIILRFESSLVCECGLSALIEIKREKGRDFLALMTESGCARTGAYNLSLLPVAYVYE